MRLLPRSRRRRIVLGVVVAGVALTAPLWWGPLLFVVKLAVPGPAYEAAADRTSDEAAAGPPLPLPTVELAPRPTGTDPSVVVEELVGLDRPSALADPPGPGAVLVTTLDGLVHAVDLEAGESEVVLDLSGSVSTGGERGLLGAAVDPAGERLYLDYTNGRGDTEIRSWPLRDGRPAGDAGDGVLHLRIGQPFENHNGGHLAFGPDGALWVGTGDGGGAGDRGEVAQDPGSLLGKMLRVVPDPEGGIAAPTTNPAWDGRAEVWGIGLRNPWRYAFDRVTNRLWVADVGQNTIEEVSVVDPGQERPNFGWDDVEGANDYEGTASPAFVPPVVTYTHDDGCSITGGTVYRGERLAGLYGWYVFADYCGGWIRAVPADDPTVEPRELASDLGPVIAFGELEDGELVVLTASGISGLSAP